VGSKEKVGLSDFKDKEGLSHVEAEV
jgi:hypothetical protein